MITSLALATVLFAQTQENPPAYRFLKDDAQRYEVKGELAVSLKGSHKDFLDKGNDAPLRMTYAALFENVVLEADGGGAKIARRVRTLKAEGEFRGETFRVVYDGERPADRRMVVAEGHGPLVRFFTLWCTHPTDLRVDAVGNVVMPDDELNRLIVKAGVMYWPAKPDKATWVNKEKIAVPLLHHKIKLDFHNAFKRTEVRGERKIMIVEAKPEIAGVETPDERVPREITAEPAFKASGAARAEIDLTHGRLSLLSLNVRIQFEGHADVAGGGKGDLRGEAVFNETQRLK